MQTGLTQRAYCTKHGLSPKTFSGWIWRLKKRGVELDQSTATDADWLAVSATPLPSSDDLPVVSDVSLELQFPGQVVLRLSLPMQQLSVLFKELHDATGTVTYCGDVERSLLACRMSITTLVKPPNNLPKSQ